MIRKYIILITIFIIIIIKLFIINVIEKDKYLFLYDKKINNLVYGLSAPRGRILDRNGKVLVDNNPIRVIIYRKNKDISLEEEIDIASSLADIIDISINNKSLINYYIIMNNNGLDLLTNEELDLYKKRRITKNELEKIKKSRVTKDMLNSLSLKEKKIATIYELMNKGYYYQNKIIMKDIDDKTYIELINNNIKGISIELSWERKYNYDNTLKDIFGIIGNIPKEDKDYYLNNGHSLDDIVGLSYLEKEYDNYLKGEKDLYKVNNDNTLTLIEEGKKGNDLILSIDIDVQLELEKLLKDNILSAKKRKNTNYFSEMYSIVGNPNTGEIIALAGQKLADKEFKNVNTNLITSSFTVGSVVKMATISTGYKYGVIDIGTKMNDGCIKLYQVPIKCSYKRLGYVSDLTAISKSSNYYQFQIAIKLTNNKYKYNMRLNTNDNDFNKFRSVFKEYGLGSITGIDLPNEKVGITGNNYSSDLLLNLSIGQYDTYTPIELYQYVNTIANNGIKKKPQLMKEVSNKKNNYETISKLSLDDKYLNRLKEAMHLATTSGTARNYINKKYNPAGKTGTSETFIDADNDGVMDTKTISIAFVGFAPYDNPLYSIVVMAPNIYVDRKYGYKKVYITRYISQGIMNFLFEKE